MDIMEKAVILLALLQCLCIARSLGFNVGTKDATIFSGSAGQEFGYTVQQLSTDQGKWLLVGSPWSGFPRNRKGDLYKCDIGDPRNPCQKLNLQDSVIIDGVQSINTNTSLGLTLIPVKKRFMTCGPLWAQRCGSQYFYPGVCAEVTQRFTLKSAFSPAIQICGGPMDVAIVLDGSNSIYPWSDVKKFLLNLLENLDIGPDQTRVSIMQYSEDLSFLYHFSFDQNKQKVLLAASDIDQQTGQETNTFAALDKTREQAFLPENGGRPGATKVLVVVTDGESADGYRGQEVIQKLDRDGIIRFGIAILKESANIQKFVEEIELIASTPTENYMFNVSSEGALVDITATLGERIFNIEGTAQGQEFQLEMSQVGFSAHHTYKKNEIMLGAVGAYGWTGTVVHQIADKSQIFPKNAFEKVLDDRNHSSLLGYSVSSVTDGSSEYYVAGAPRAVHRGQVVVYSINSQKQAVVIDSQRGDQIGSYFGSVLCPVDVDADVVTDLLLVGAPMYMSEEKAETGRVYMFTITKGILSKQGILEGPSVFENARFGMTIIAVPDLNLDGFSDVVVGAPLEANGQGAIYIYYGDRKSIRTQSSQRILGAKLDPKMRFFGRSLDSREDMNRDSIPDISVGGEGKVVQLWSRGIASVSTRVSFNPEKVSIVNKTCLFGGKMVPCVTAKVCFRSTFRPTGLGKVDIKYSLMLDADLQSSRVTSRAQFENKDRTIQKEISIFDKETCVDHIFYVQETPDFISPVGLRVNISSQDSDNGPVLDAFLPTAWEFFVPFVKDCGPDDKCTCDLKLTVKAVNVPSSSSLLVGPDRRRLPIMVTVTNTKENAYNTRVSANFSSNLFYASFTPPANNIEVKCASKTGSLDCQVAYPTLLPGQTVTFEINFDFNLNQLQKNAVVNFEAQSDSEEEVTSDNKVSLSIPVQYDAEIILTRDINLDFCMIGEEDQVQHKVSNFDDIGREFNITLRVSTGTFPVNQAHLRISLPTKTKNGDHLLYLTSVKTSPAANVRCDDSQLIDPLKIREKTYTASFTKQSFRGTTELNCKSSKCEQMICLLKDLEMKSSYFINITARIWNGTFAYADFQTVLLTGSAEVETSQPDLIVVTHKQQQIKIKVIKERAIGDIPIGIIIGSVLGGLLLFALVTVILWKVGFFKRKALPQQGDEQEQAEQEGLCENPA
ncbi:integrin alpha-2 [Danio rerio]|uniref:Integrin alpha-2 isoform X1 n=1 Tax=Danio rerio TaxID=7955 RepID=A0A8M9PTU0_DANRE|nr:integrin alpha-2 isoform X1 [Danio rerio]XP_021334932.1 integrin alpha-2 isoform X1 [Danio rerio]|eukprot:XP_021327896.1 integrin alpha-2 isoform X1 [Danio rerio]